MPFGVFSKKRSSGTDTTSKVARRDWAVVTIQRHMRGALARMRHGEEVAAARARGRDKYEKRKMMRRSGSRASAIKLTTRSTRSSMQSSREADSMQETPPRNGDEEQGTEMKALVKKKQKRRSMMEMLDSAEVDLESSIKVLKDRIQAVDGYKELSGFLIFFFLFLAMVTLQLKIGESYQVESSLRQVVVGLEERGAIEDVVTMTDFWNYLLGDDDRFGDGLISKVFVEEWYNGDALTEDEEGYILDYNKLVGGVLLVQKRRKQSSCLEKYPGTVYNMFYPDCRYEDSFTTEPFGPGDRFTYSEEYGGYAEFLSISNSRAQLQEYVEGLKRDRWLDKQTASVHLKFAVYNGQLQIFSFVDAPFNFFLGGIMAYPYTVKISSVTMEPYITSADTLRLVMEILFVIGVGFQFASEGWDFVTTVYDRGVSGYFESFWNYVDMANIGCFMATVLMRSAFLYFVFDNPVVVPTSSYQTVLERAAQLIQGQTVLNVINILIGVVRMFKYLDFQGRLAVVQGTFGRSWTDSYHVLLMFAVVFFGFAFMGYLLFGSSVYTYSNFFEVSVVLVNMILGAVEYYDVGIVQPVIGAIFVIAFVFIATFVLVNIFLAIIIDAYTQAWSEASSTEPVVGQLAFVFADRRKTLKSGVPRLTNDAIISILRQYQEEDPDRKFLPMVDLIDDHPSLSHHEADLLVRLRFRDLSPSEDSHRELMAVLKSLVMGPQDGDETTPPDTHRSAL